MLLINRSVLWIFIRHFHSFNRIGAYMAITLKLRFVLFNASDTFTWFTLSFFFYTKTSWCLQVSLLFVHYYFLKSFFSFSLKAKYFAFAEFCFLLFHDFFWIIREIQLFVAIKGNFLVYSLSEQVAEKGNTPRDYLIHVTICLFAYS